MVEELPEEEEVAERILEDRWRAFQEIMKAIQIDEQLWDKPLVRSSDAHLGINNSRSLATCMILYLYSMELGGGAPLYAELNRVLREKQEKYLEQLGPMAQALKEICQWADENKRWEEKGGLTTGEKFSEKWDNLSGCFLIWKGARMR